MAYKFNVIKCLNELYQNYSYNNLDYLIKKLILTHLTVELVQANGKVQRFPTIQRMEFHNISSETGFPIDEIEKAIFKMMMQELMQKFNLDDLLNPFKAVPENSPLKYLPQLFK